MSDTLEMPLTAFAPAIQPAVQDDPEVKRLRSSHELWHEYAPRWSFYLSAYNGGEEFACAANLFKHAREAQPDYDERVKRLDNMNYCEPLVSFFTNFIFAESIDRNGGTQEDFFKTFSQDVSRREETLDDFMRQVSDDMQIFGMSYVLVDSPPLRAEEGEPIDTPSQQDVENQNVRPYWVLIHPAEVTDWAVDEFGNLIYAKRRQISEDWRLDLEVGATDVQTNQMTAVGVTSGGKRKYEKYTEFFPDRYVISLIDITKPSAAQLVSQTVLPNVLGEVPIRVSRYKRSKKHPHVGLSFLNDFAYNNRRILNINSMLDEFLYRQCFNILAKETESNIPLREQEEGLIGTSNVMEYPKGAHVPQYISPPVDPAKILQDERGRIITQMYLRASQDTMNELFNGEKSSGFSQAQSFSKTVPFISSRADALERLETQLMQITMRVVGKNWDGKIKYKDRYELTNLTSALTQLLMLVKDFQMGSVSETFVKTQLTRMVHEYDGKLGVDDQVKIENEISKMDFKGWAANQQTAFLGAPKTSPGAQQKPKQDIALSEREGDTGTVGHATVELRG